MSPFSVPDAVAEINQQLDTMKIKVTLVVNELQLPSFWLPRMARCRRVVSKSAWSLNEHDFEQVAVIANIVTQLSHMKVVLLSVLLSQAQLRYCR